MEYKLSNRKQLLRLLLYYSLVVLLALRLDSITPLKILIIQLIVRDIMPVPFEVVLIPLWIFGITCFHSLYGIISRRKAYFFLDYKRSNECIPCVYFCSLSLNETI